MTITLQIVDPSDTVLFDLNDPTGTNSGLYGSVYTEIGGDFDIGSPALQSTTVDSQDLDATFSAFSKRATASMKGTLVLTGTSNDNMVTAIGTLAQYSDPRLCHEVRGGRTDLLPGRLTLHDSRVGCGGHELQPRRRAVQDRS